MKLYKQYRHQSSRRLSAHDDFKSRSFSVFSKCWGRRWNCETKISLGKGSSQPDTIAHLPLAGWPINIIPLCMAATQFG